MPTRRNRVMRFLNTLRNKLTRRRKKSRSSRRRRKPRMSRLRRFLNRNRNRLRTRKNVAKGKNQQPKKFKSNCKPSGTTVIKPTVNSSLRRALQNTQSQQRKKVTFSSSNFKPLKKPSTVDDLVKALQGSNLQTPIKRTKSVMKNLNELVKGGKRRKSRKKNKRKY